MAPRRRRTVVLLALAAAIALLVWFGTRSRKAVRDEDDPDPLPEIVNPGYVGAAACAECHAARHDEFSRTRHFAACTLPDCSRAESGVLSTRDPNLRWQIELAGQRFTATAIEGERQAAYDIGLVYGAGGNSDEMYLAWQGDRLVNPPIAWLSKSKRWAHAVDGAAAREVPPSCLECHNTWAGHVPGTANEYQREGMLLGVSCERCHGPGRDHIQHHRLNPGGPAAAILHPGKLERQQLIEVCTQCHGNIRPRTAAFTHRPGQPLEDHYRILHTKNPEDEQVANQIRSLSESKCFQKSEMTCITCHNPHRASSAETVRRSCAKCHEPSACREQPKLPEAVRADCAGCHMPPRVWMNVRFHFDNEQYVPATSRFDHRIAVHPEAKSSVLLAWKRSQNNPTAKKDAEALAAHWLAEAERRRTAGRPAGEIGAVREALRADDSPAVRKRLDEAIVRMREYENLVAAGNDGARPAGERIATLEKILAIAPGNAAARGELGTLFVLRGQTIAGIAELERASAQDPDDAYSVKTLAALRFREGDAAGAAVLFARAADIEPLDSGIQNGWGTSLLKLQRWPDAEARFRRTLELHPRDAAGNDGLGRALLEQGRIEPALLHARRAVRYSDSKDAGMLITLADACLAANRAEDAKSTLEKARSLAAPANQAELLLEIRKRMDRLR